MKCLGQCVRNVQFHPSGLPDTPGSSPTNWGRQITNCPALDSAGVLARAVPEMQMQSYGAVIRVFPAWPKGWQSEFTLAADGGFLVSSRVNTNGEIPEVRIRSQFGGACTVVNPWPGDAVFRSKHGARSLAQTNRFVLSAKPGDEFVLTPTGAAAKFEPIPVACNAAPKWPFHQGPDDTIEAYLMRTQSFGMLGIAKDGQNLTRNREQKALAEQEAKTKGLK